MTFTKFALQPELIRALEAMAFEHPTPIQAAAVPAALEGADVLGSAQTGSGKTVAFALPLLNKLLTEPAPEMPAAAPAPAAEPERGRGRGRRGGRGGGRGPGGPMRSPRGLVLTPTRELAAQVEATLKECSQFTTLHFALVIGGESMNNQVEALRRGADVVIATPGRLLDHLENTRGFTLDGVQVLILDEADRMLDMGFLPDVRRILSHLPAERQNLMFSATVPKEIESLISRFMREPVRIQIDPPRRPAEGVRQSVYPVTHGQKYDLLHALLDRPEVSSSLVFTATRRRADMVANFLKNRGMDAAPMHADLSQSVRTRTLEDFRDQKTRVLVATDIAARGLDIRHVSHVFNFDVPLYAEDYLHRIGRTARAFTVGDAVTLMAPDEKSALESIERFVGSDVERRALEGFEYDVPPRLTSFKPTIHSRFGSRRRSIRRGRRGIL